MVKRIVENSEDMNIKAKVQNIIRELDNETYSFEDYGLEELNDICNDLGETSLDGYVYAIDKVIKMLKDIIK